MKVTLISPYTDLAALGLRSISAYLKQEGHEVRNIFLMEVDAHNPREGVIEYEDTTLDSLIPFLADADLIGFSLMTSFYQRTVQVTKKIRDKLSTPIIWGGVHPTVRPEECLQWADMVCVGEGEDAMLELCNRWSPGNPPPSIRNIWTRDEGTVKRTDQRPLGRELSFYPAPDYSLNDDYIIRNQRLTKLTPGLFQLAAEASPLSLFAGSPTYQTMTGRGCPHQCTYCVNDVLKNLNPDYRLLRWRTLDDIFSELHDVKKRFPYIGCIWFSDDNFLSRKTSELEDFCCRYKKEISLPFFCLASPLTVRKDKLDLLVDAGLSFIQIGIESGSDRILNMYNRARMSQEKVVKAVELIHSYRDRLLGSYDFLVDNPYEDQEDTLATLKLIARMPLPFHFRANSLIMYPGTKMFQMAHSDGLIDDISSESFSRRMFHCRKPRYTNFLLALAQRGLLRGHTLNILSSRPFLFLFQRTWFERLLAKLLNHRQKK